MSSTTLPVCPKTGSTSPSLTVHLCLHTAPGNRECAHRHLPELELRSVNFSHDGNVAKMVPKRVDPWEITRKEYDIWTIFAT